MRERSRTTRGRAQDAQSHRGGRTSRPARPVARALLDGSGVPGTRSVPPWKATARSPGKVSRTTKAGDRPDEDPDAAPGGRRGLPRIVPLVARRPDRLRGPARVRARLPGIAGSLPLAA